MTLLRSLSKWLLETVRSCCRGPLNESVTAMCHLESGRSHPSVSRHTENCFRAKLLEHDNSGRNNLQTAHPELPEGEDHDQTELFWGICMKGREQTQYVPDAINGIFTQ